MSDALLIARLVLAAVFATAGMAKVANGVGFRQGVAGFGLPRVLVSPVARLLPVVELACAVALLPAGSARWGALGALGLLSLFSVVVVLNLAMGKKPHCRCFGQLHSAPVGGRTLVRNGALLATAALVVWPGGDRPGPSAVAWVADLTAPAQFAVIGASVFAVVVVAEGWLLVKMFAQQARLLVRVDAVENALLSGSLTGPTPAPTPAPTPGLPVGTPAPDFALPGLFGETLTLPALRAAGLPVMLIFTDPACGPCQALMPEIGRWQAVYEGGRLTIAVISNGDRDVNRIKATQAGLRRLLVQTSYEVAEAYRSEGTPGAVLIGADGLVASPLAVGADAIKVLVADVAGEPRRIPVVAVNGGHLNGGHLNGGGSHASPPTTPGIGQPAPAISLPDLEGNRVELASFGGHDTVVLFWNPGCGFCQRMLADLQVWEAGADQTHPKLLVVSTGSAEAHEDMGLRASVLLDNSGEAMRRYGATGTPMAILVDPAGRVASDLAVGKDAVLSLLSTHPSPARPPGCIELQPALAGDR